MTSTDRTLKELAIAISDICARNGTPLSPMQAVEVLGMIEETVSPVLRVAGSECRAVNYRNVNLDTCERIAKMCDGLLGTNATLVVEDDGL
jgi:hypothetical protein